MPPGKFSWNLNGILTDTEGYASMSADQILADLFKDAKNPPADHGSCLSGR